LVVITVLVFCTIESTARPEIIQIKLCSHLLRKHLDSDPRLVRSCSKSNDFRVGHVLFAGFSIFHFSNIAANPAGAQSMVSSIGISTYALGKLCPACLSAQFDLQLVPAHQTIRSRPQLMLTTEPPT
jgi:hypothetical protein